MENHLVLMPPMNKQQTIKRLRKVLIMAFCGALIFAGLALLDVAIIANNPINFGGGGDASRAKHWLQAIPYYLCLPGDLLQLFIGSGITSSVIGNAIVGAVCFGLLTAYYQFLLKGDYDN